MLPLRILIAEDEAVIALLLNDVLTGLGHSVCAHTTTVQDTVEAAALHRPDLLLIDVGLGNQSGIDAIALITAVQPVRHIYMSGNAHAVRQKCPGAVILEKPFHEADLSEAIRRATAV
jgi:two-component system, response regulator PdtaR